MSGELLEGSRQALGGFPSFGLELPNRRENVLEKRWKRDGVDDLELPTLDVSGLSSLPSASDSVRWRWVMLRGPLEVGLDHRLPGRGGGERESLDAAATSMSPMALSQALKTKKLKVKT